MIIWFVGLQKVMWILIIWFSSSLNIISRYKIVLILCTIINIMPVISLFYPAACVTSIIELKILLSQSVIKQWRHVKSWNGHSLVSTHRSKQCPLACNNPSKAHPRTKPPPAEEEKSTNTLDIKPSWQQTYTIATNNCAFLFIRSSKWLLSIAMWSVCGWWLV